MEQWPVRVPNVGPWRWRGRGGDRLLGNGDEIRRRPLAAAVIRLHGPAFHSNGAAGGRHLLLLLDPHPSNFLLFILPPAAARLPVFSWINGRYYRLSHRSVEIQIRDFESVQILSLHI